MIATEAALPAADFSNDTWWIWVIKAVAILVFLLTSVILALWVERRVLGRMQTRLGPNVAGPLGLGQAVWDALKLILKEDINLRGADRLLYLLAPMISAFCAFMIYAVIPFGPEVSMFGVTTPLQLTDFSTSVLYILAIAALGVYGIVLGGWSSNSTYPLLGAVRSSAQVISYELAMGLSLVSVFLVSGTLSTSQIVEAQTQIWWVVSLLPAFVIFVIAMFGEVNRLPFDLPEAEGELVAGHMVEYSSMKFAWFYLAEYINMLNVSAIATTLFLGGWRAPFGLGQIADGMFNEGWWPLLWFLGKVWVMMFLFIWTRGTLLRFRYDQFMNIGWKVLIPAGLVWIVGVALVQGIRQFSDFSLTQLILGIVVTFAIIMGIAMLWPEKKDDVKEAEDRQDVLTPDGYLDAFAGGYPVPPLPGQSLPPSPRASRRATAEKTTTATSTKSTTDKESDDV